MEVHPFLPPPPILGTRNISIASSFKHPSIYKRADLKQIGQVIEDFFLWMASVKIGRNVFGHDIGSMVAHALVRSHPSVVRGAIILYQVIPGIDGWEEIQVSPAVWHMPAGISRSVRERGNWAPILETLKCR